MNIAKQPRAVLATLIAAMLAPTVHAADQGWYVSAGLGRAKSDISLAELNSLLIDPAIAFYQSMGVFESAYSTLHYSDTTRDLMFGYRFNPYFAVEGGHTDLGAAKYNATVTTNAAVKEYDNVHARFKSSGLTLAIVGGLPIGNKWDVHGKLGLYRAKTKFDSGVDILVVFPDATQLTDSLLIESLSANTTELVYGLGATLKIGEQWHLSLDWARYDSVGDKNKTGEANVDTLGLKAAFYLSSRSRISRARIGGQGWYVSAGLGQTKTDTSKSELDNEFLFSVARSFQGLGTVESAVSSLDDSDAAWDVMVGYQFNPYMSVEAGYTNLGTSTYKYAFGGTFGPSVFSVQGGEKIDQRAQVQAKSSGWVIAAIGTLPINQQLDVHAKLGMYRPKTTLEVGGNYSIVSDVGAPLLVGRFPDEISSSHTTELLYGIGASLDVSQQWRLSLDWTRYDSVGDKSKTGEANVDTLGLKAAFHF